MFIYENNDQLKKELKKLVIDSGKTQKEVADILGISQSYISRLEKRIMKQLKKDIARYELHIDFIPVQSEGK